MLNHDKHSFALAYPTTGSILGNFIFLFSLYDLHRNKHCVLWIHLRAVSTSGAGARPLYLQQQLQENRDKHGISWLAFVWGFGC
jgi:hypothetical protein